MVAEVQSSYGTARVGIHGQGESAPAAPLFSFSTDIDLSRKSILDLRLMVEFGTAEQRAAAMAALNKKDEKKDDQRTASDVVLRGLANSIGGDNTTSATVGINNSVGIQTQAIRYAEASYNLNDPTKAVGGSVTLANYTVKTETVSSPVTTWASGIGGAVSAGGALTQQQEKMASKSARANSWYDDYYRYEYDRERQSAEAQYAAMKAKQMSALDQHALEGFNAANMAKATAQIAAKDAREDQAMINQGLDPNGKPQSWYDQGMTALNNAKAAETAAGVRQTMAQQDASAGLHDDRDTAQVMATNNQVQTAAAAGALASIQDARNDKTVAAVSTSGPRLAAPPALLQMPADATPVPGQPGTYKSAQGIYQVEDTVVGRIVSLKTATTYTENNQTTGEIFYSDLQTHVRTNWYTTGDKRGRVIADGKTTYFDKDGFPIAEPNKADPKTAALAKPNAPTPADARDEVEKRLAAENTTEDPQRKWMGANNPYSNYDALTPKTNAGKKGLPGKRGKWAPDPAPVTPAAAAPSAGALAGSVVGTVASAGAAVSSDAASTAAAPASTTTATTQVADAGTTTAAAKKTWAPGPQA